METHRIQLNLALILLLLNSVLTQKTVPLSSDSERSALLDLRSTLGLRAKDWPRKADPCSAWTGINCKNGRVVGINVSGLNRTHAGRKNPRFSVDSLVNFAHLASFNSSGFSLPGSIPYWFGQRLSSLQVLDLSSCSITGSIPVSFGNLSRLNSLHLSDNFLTGAIPSTLSQSSNLSTINVSQNSLTGAIPAALSALHGLSSLDLSSNLLSGPIPPGLGLLSELQFLNLRNNSLTSSIPAQLGNLSHLIELDLGLNDLSGSLTEELRGLRSLQKISVQNNNLSGPLPRNLFLNLNQVQYVILSSNKFNGSLLDVLQSMPQLLFLNISGNEFTGVLPDITETFNATNATFDVSDNYFEGPANSSNGNNVVITKNCIRNLPNQRSLQECEMFYTNRGLTFEDHATPDTMLSPIPKPASNQRRRITYLVVGLFGGHGFIVLLVVMLLLLLKTCGKQSTNQSAAKMGPVPGSSSPRLKTINSSGLGVSFTYEQMLQATGDFSDTSLIKHGQSGDLFYGTLESGFPVVIKRVDLLAFGKETYMLELDIFSLLSHPRLVPLLGHCLEHENEKLLVYKYMPLKDLSNSLYKTPAVDDDGLQSLDWITRSKIAIGAAEALSYLHHECNPPIVHRDVQASSILLDDKYEVRLGSLSEARAQGVDDQHNVITRLLRVPQNSRQGPSGSSTAACAYDVYCFGKVLLELVTGKLGFSQTDDVNTKEWLDQNLPYISIHEKEPVSKIVDESLILDEDLLDEVWSMAIVAKSCLNPKPSKRPLMRHVLRALENPWKVIREENYNSGHLKASSSIRSWSFAFFGSWHHSSSESANQEHISVFKQSNRVGSRGSGTNEHSSSHKRSSSDVFPEPIDMQDVERQDQN